MTHTSVNISYATTQFPVFSFCDPHAKPHAVRWSIKYYHLRLDLKSGHENVQYKEYPVLVYNAQPCWKIHGNMVLILPNISVTNLLLTAHTVLCYYSSITETSFNLPIIKNQVKTSMRYLR